MAVSDFESYIEAKVAKYAFVRIFASGIPFVATLRIYVGGKKVSQAKQVEEEPAEFARCFPQSIGQGGQNAIGQCKCLSSSKSPFFTPCWV